MENKEEHYEAMMQSVERYCPSADMAEIQKAYEYADKKHAGQLPVAEIVAEIGLDTDAIVASLLHDCLEDTDASYEEISRLFGQTVAELVEGVTKLTRVQYTSKEDEQMENLRKMLLAMSKDIRVILIKIADRLHNMRTHGLPVARKSRSGKIDGDHGDLRPLAHRLGMQKIKWELEDLALLYLDPDGYKEITDCWTPKCPAAGGLSWPSRSRSERLAEREHPRLGLQPHKAHLQHLPQDVRPEARRSNGIFDLCAFRVIVDTIPDCYNVLGIIHDLYKPVPGRFKDYISTPKPNMYQSLHTTVIGSEGIPFEVQIRTWEMHRTAEYGVAAHWKYKHGQPLRRGGGDEESYAWVRKTAGEPAGLRRLRLLPQSEDRHVRGRGVRVLPEGRRHQSARRRHAHRLRVQHPLRRGQLHDGRVRQRPHRHLRPCAAKRRHRGDPHVQKRPGPSRDWLNMAQERLRPHKIKQWFKRENAARRTSCAARRVRVGAALTGRRRRRLYRRARSCCPSHSQARSASPRWTTCTPPSATAASRPPRP
jgi:guanosine-3',5'-bis(diphosphate) 3'-pyrophosphohydrolase